LAPNLSFVVIPAKAGIQRSTIPDRANLRIERLARVVS